MNAFLPYAPPSSKPETLTAAERRLNLTLAAVMWAFAFLVVAAARYGLTR